MTLNNLVLDTPTAHTEFCYVALCRSRGRNCFLSQLCFYIWLCIILFHLWKLECSSFIHQWLYSPLLGPGLFFSFVIFFVQTVRLLGRGISPSQGCYLHTGQHKHRINAYTDIHGLGGIRTHDRSVRAKEDSSWLRPRCHCDRQKALLHIQTYPGNQSSQSYSGKIRTQHCNTLQGRLHAGRRAKTVVYGEIISKFVWDLLLLLLFI
jgi:hypothetical protein